MRVKELDNVPGLEEGQKVIIKKFGYGSLSMLRSLSTQAGMGNRGGIQAKVDLGKYMTYLLVLGIKEAPFFENMKTIEQKIKFVEDDGISAETGEYIRKEVQKLNNFGKMDEVKKK